MGHSTFPTRVCVVEIPGAVPNEGDENNGVSLNCCRVKLVQSESISCATTLSHQVMLPA